MKPVDHLTDDEFAPLVKRASELPEPPPAWVDAAIEQWPKPASAHSVAQAAARLLVAALRFDSWAAAPLAFGMRALPADTRHLLFSAMGRDIDLRISPAARHFALTGQILGPDESGRVQLVAQADPSAEARIANIDALGEFRLDDVELGCYLLTLHMGGDEIVLPPIEVGPRHG
jgi:hypothetical protein